MKSKLLGTAITGLGLIALLMLSLGNTPVLALPAADDLAPGETFDYTLSMYSRVDSLFDSDAYDNTTGKHVYTTDFSNVQSMGGSEVGTINVNAVSSLGNGNSVAIGTSSGNTTGYSNTDTKYFEYNNFTGTVVANDSYTNNTQYPVYVFSGRDFSFVYNASLVPHPDMVIPLLFNATYEPPVNQSYPLSLNLISGDEFNIPFVADFFVNFTPSFINTTSTGSDTYEINGYWFNVNILHLKFESHINQAFNGTVVDAFTVENYTNPVNWSVYATITFDMTINLLYDKDTGLLLRGDIDGGMTISVYANTIIKNYDPDGASGPIQPIDLLGTVFSRTEFFLQNSFVINGVSYLYTSPPTTSNTTSSNSSNNTSSQNANSTNTGNNNTNTPFAGLPAPGIEIAITSLVSTIAIMAITRKRK